MYYIQHLSNNVYPLSNIMGSYLAYKPKESNAVQKAYIYIYIKQVGTTECFKCKRISCVQELVCDQIFKCLMVAWKNTVQTSTAKKKC